MRLCKPRFVIAGDDNVARLGARRRLGKHSLLIVGAGDVAARALPFVPRSWHVLALVRRKEAAALWRQRGARVVRGDLDDWHQLRRLGSWARLVWYLAPPPPQGSDDPRVRRLQAAMLRRPYSAARPVGIPWACRGIAPTRTIPSASVVSVAAFFGSRRGRGVIDPCLRQHRPLTSRQKRCRRIVYVSTSGVYGDRQGAWVHETDPVAPETARAQRRVAAERAWRRWSAHGGWSVRLRVPGIYAADRLPLAALRAGAPVVLPEEDSYSNHIHADDLARTLWLAAWRGRNGRCYHVSDGKPLLISQWYEALAQAYGLPKPPALPRSEVLRRSDPMRASFLAESRRLDTARLRCELRIRLRYPEVSVFLQALRA